MENVFISEKEPEPVAQASKLSSCHLHLVANGGEEVVIGHHHHHHHHHNHHHHFHHHLVDNGEVVVGDVDGDRPRGEEDQGLEQSLCLQDQLVSLLLVEVFRSSDGIQNRVDNRPSAIFYISN